MSEILNKKNIVLIGMPGSGKTTIGKLLASVLGMKFVDSDDYIEKRYATTIKDMFEVSEDYFRDCEAKCIKKISEDFTYIVLATGGGVIKKTENITRLKSNSIIIFLDRDVDSILSSMQDDEKRPLLQGEKRKKLQELLGERYNAYLQNCDYRVVCLNKTCDDITHEIKAYLGEVGHICLYKT